MGQVTKAVDLKPGDVVNLRGIDAYGSATVLNTERLEGDGWNHVKVKLGRPYCYRSISGHPMIGIETFEPYSRHDEEWDKVGDRFNYADP